MAATQQYLPIEDYAVIGDCHTAALVSSRGSIDWYCPGRFDNPAVFCRILDAKSGGFLKIDCGCNEGISRKYLEHTNILRTNISCNDTKLQITQFMPVRSRDLNHREDDVKTPFRIMTSIEVLSAYAEIRLAFKPTFNFAKEECQFSNVPDGVIASWLTHHLVLFAQGVKFHITQEGAAEGIRKLKQGEKLWIILDYSKSGKSIQITFTENECEFWFKETLSYWNKWVERCTYSGAFRNEVIRSALVLKLLTYEPTGAIIAAPTTSLPEEIGGLRNWDYRFTWLRDSALILYALMTIGYQAEATDFFRWLKIALKKDPKAIPQIMYKIDGDGRIHETILDHLEGYKRSQPVRIGNAAASQFQLDIFGEVLTSAYLYFMHDEAEDTQDTLDAKHLEISEVWPILMSLTNHAAEKWIEPDNGIWEIRGAPREFLYSRLMCWAALDRGIRLAKKFHLHAPIAKWETVISTIREAILSKGFNKNENAFTQSFGSEALDAGALIIPRIGFLPPTDPRVISTIDNIKKKLSHNGLIYRYLNKDGLPGTEATFSMCTFWQVDALALSGRQDEAMTLFEKMLRFTNDVGLMSEELDSAHRVFLGNFPQGFTHLSLIGSAVNLAKAAKHGPEKHPETEAQRAGRARSAAKQDYTPAMK